MSQFDDKEMLVRINESTYIPAGHKHRLVNQGLTNLVMIEVQSGECLLLNPMAGLIDEYRNIMIRGVWPDPGRLAIILFSAIVLGLLALALLKRMDHKHGKTRF